MDNAIDITGPEHVLEENEVQELLETSMEKFGSRR